MVELWRPWLEERIGTDFDDLAVAVEEQGDFSKSARRLIAHLELASEDENDTDISADGNETDNDQDPVDGEGEGDGDESDAVVDSLRADGADESDADIIDSDELQMEASDDGEPVNGSGARDGRQPRATYPWNCDDDV